MSSPSHNLRRFILPKLLDNGERSHVYFEMVYVERPKKEPGELTESDKQALERAQQRRLARRKRPGGSSS